MRRTVAAGTVLLWVLQASAQTPAADPLDPSFRPAVNSIAASYPNNVWITGPLVKVLQNAGAPGSDHSITVNSAKNEIQSFQVHVQASADPINELNVTMSDLVNAQTGDSIGAATTDIVVFREAYQNVTIPTAYGATFLNTTGYIPDILIPAIDPYYQQTTNAFPFTVQPGQNQSVWIDVHVPPSVPSGYYAGTVTVSSGSAVLAAMPVIYAVWNWSMPSTASLPSYTNIGYGGLCIQSYGAEWQTGCANYPGSQGGSDYGVTMTQVDAAVQLLDNRYSIGGMTNVYPGSGSFSTFTAAYGPLLGGTAAHVSGILQGAKLTSWNMSLLPTTITQSTFQNFQSVFGTNGWVIPWYSLADEPSGAAAWQQIVTTGTQLHSFGTSIPSGVTADLPTATANNAQDVVDRLIVNIVSLEPGGPGATGLQSLAAYNAWMQAAPAGGPPRSFWSYQSCTSSGTCGNGVSGNVQVPFGYPNTYPNYDVDGTPVANRVMEWMTYLHGQQGELYYSVEICDYTAGVATLCGVGAPGVTTSPGNPILSNYYSGGWGDGTLIYPGTPSYAGVTTPIWLPSIRLKMIRDGMQDYEYLNALTKAGQGALATQQIKSFITNTYTFSNNPAGLTAARQALGTQLHQMSLPATSTQVLAR
jgi:hypothetical protein